MNTNEEIPINHGDEIIRGSYTTALTNPGQGEFKNYLDNSSKTILDIGVGAEQPQLSWDLEKDLWVGCDPGIRMPKSGRGVQIQTGDKEIDKDSKLIIFTQPVERVPQFFPDHISVVAPNPQDIINGEIFNKELVKFLSGKTGKKQSLVVVLDDRTHESAKYRDEAAKTIKQWAKDNDFEEDDIDDAFEPNSHDLGPSSNNLYLSYSRN